MKRLATQVALTLLCWLLTCWIVVTVFSSATSGRTLYHHPRQKVFYRDLGSPYLSDAQAAAARQISQALESDVDTSSGSLAVTTAAPINISQHHYLLLLQKSLDEELNASTSYLNDPNREATAIARFGSSLALPLPKPHIFIHLPKCGGTFIRDTARRNTVPALSRSLWFSPYDDPRAMADLQAHFPSDTIGGHFAYGMHFFAPEQRGSYFTFMRNPVERVISHYNYHKNRKSDPNHAATVNKTLEQWTRTSINANNRMTQFLSGLENVVPDDHMFELAKFHLLTRFSFVGLMDEMTLSLKGCYYYLNWKTYVPPAPRPLSTTNRADVGYHATYSGARHRHKPPTDSERAAIEEMNRYDMELYRIGTELFKAGMARIADEPWPVVRKPLYSQAKPAVKPDMFAPLKRVFTPQDLFRSSAQQRKGATEMQTPQAQAQPQAQPQAQIEALSPLLSPLLAAEAQSQAQQEAARQAAADAELLSHAEQLSNALTQQEEQQALANAAAMQQGELFPPLEAV